MPINLEQEQAETLTRRDFLKLVWVEGATAMLAACGIDASSNPEAQTPLVTPDVDLPEGWVWATFNYRDVVALSDSVAPESIYSYYTVQAAKAFEEILANSPDLIGVYAAKGLEFVGQGILLPVQLATFDISGGHQDFIEGPRYFVRDGEVYAIDRSQRTVKILQLSETDAATAEDSDSADSSESEDTNQNKPTPDAKSTDPDENQSEGPAYLKSGKVGELLRKWEERGIHPLKIRGFLRQTGEEVEINLPYYNYTKSNVSNEDLIDLVNAARADNIRVILNIGPGLTTQPLYEAKKMEEETGSPVLNIAVDWGTFSSRMRVYTEELPPENSSAFLFGLDARNQNNLKDFKVDQVSIIGPDRVYFIPEYIEASMRVTNPGGKIIIVTEYDNPIDQVPMNLRPYSTPLTMNLEQYIKSFGMLQSQITEDYEYFHVVTITAP